MLEIWLMEVKCKLKKGGNFETKNGMFLGKHRGYPFYTIDLCSHLILFFSCLYFSPVYHFFSYLYLSPVYHFRSRWNDDLVGFVRSMRPCIDSSTSHCLPYLSCLRNLPPIESKRHPSSRGSKWKEVCWKQGVRTVQERDSSINPLYADDEKFFL